MKKLLFLLMAAGVVLGAKSAIRPIPRDTIDIVEVVTYPDTVFDSSLPAVEILPGTYHNFNGCTTAGYQLISRGTEFEITGAILYTGHPQGPMHTISPFRMHVGDSTNHNRIDVLKVENKFPFTATFSGDDSLVVLTDRGNVTLYWNDERRAAAHYNPIIEGKAMELRQIKFLAITVLVVVLICFGIIVAVQTARKRRQKQEVERMLSFVSEAEMKNRELQGAVSDLLKKNFETINRLCYEYFEKADTAILKKSIYNEVENEILKLKDAAQISRLEEILNRYCNGIMQRVCEQLPDLADKERTLLIYLYSGLSARAICILTDIQIKNFYMRRQRLKSKILNSSAPDKEEFASKM